ncbi:SDR family NAD(P)-dependent oxidoreductase [Nocardia alba]|uniref:NAD(P)-dependent dehydrogenase (Short-subunit alcohol dehydrogenase family) n=1 Tax=Nocardia alba TaxID=225051 RepID=A0A4R1FUW0_9NOCA|nr:SDR family NAD(P)-dependent oxidoreductase [Nocardia alba]TCJ95041.1 NAD(P)-dependent dehydrogenase (short-subunit alcohol dehydrogenase family) [Nocardia alba]
MRTYVITGGTDGMGKGLGLYFLRRGDRVIAIASGAAKGAALLREADAIGASERAVFLRADLSTLAGMSDALARVTSLADTVDGLVFGAQRFRPRREITEDGIEFTFALHYLSRFVLGHGLTDAVARANTPVIMNICGPGGFPGRIHWDDLTLREGYTGTRAAMQASRANDLLGVAFPHRYPNTRTRYVLYNPMMVRTAMAEPLPTPHRILAKAAGYIVGRSVDQAVPPIARHLDEPPTDPLTAFRRRTRLPLTRKDFDPDNAIRLDTLTTELVQH